MAKPSPTDGATQTATKGGGIGAFAWVTPRAYATSLDPVNDGNELEDMMPMDPPPDEDAWEAYLDFTLKLMEADGSNAVSNQTVTAIEAALGSPLPFEVAVLFLIGVPNSDGWQRWGDDPATQLTAWNEQLTAALRDTHGQEVAAGLSTASPLVPIYDGFAVPVGAAAGHDTADSNPVFAIQEGMVSVAANDLAAWLHQTFDMPLPWWPDTPDKRFLFWSDLT